MSTKVDTKIYNSGENVVKFTGSKAVVVTPSDTDFINPCNLFVGTGGDLKVAFVGDRTTAILLKNIPDGSFLPIEVVKVYDTDTTADDIVALY